MSFSSGKVLEPINHHFVYTPESSFQSNDLGDFNESCHNGRFIKHDELISKSKYRTIHRGYDNESGCEIAWSAYNLKANAAIDMRNMMLEELRKVQSVTNKYILKVIYFETRPYKKPEKNDRRSITESIVQPE